MVHEGVCQEAKHMRNCELGNGLGLIVHRRDLRAFRDCVQVGCSSKAKGPILYCVRVNSLRILYFYSYYFITEIRTRHTRARALFFCALVVYYHGKGRFLFSICGVFFFEPLCGAPRPSNLYPVWPSPYVLCLLTPRTQVQIVVNVTVHAPMSLKRYPYVV